MTLDGIGSDGELNQMAYDIAADQGFTVPFENCLFSSSHSHSGPGAVSSDFLWSIAPATDLLVPELQRSLANSTAVAMLQALKNMVPAVMDIGMGDLIGVTQNRRAKFSPYVQPGSIDPHLGVIRLDAASNSQPIATIWNFAVHGVCYGPDNLQFSGDIMGKACEIIEKDIGGIALFINADAGDIDPAEGMCAGVPDFKGSGLMAQAVEKVRATLKPTAAVEIQSYTQVIPFGPTNLNATLGRFDNCTSGGFLDICSICAVLDCDINAHLNSAWIQQNPRFTAFSFVINGKSTITVSMPGEALLELGWWIRNDTLAMGFDQTFLTGYSNNHMGYFATPDEYDIGGYESELTLWGIQTADLVRTGCQTVAQNVIPQKNFLQDSK
uniref:Neutral ceramidase n=1 Tax=Arcella intermedia TaxID=1963864 RepID=A0A6B2L787_9EUKA